MVELLEPGTEAETFIMAGRGMNGLKGVIVCFNPNNQRYTLELAKGDMMSLKFRDVKAMAPNRGGGEDLAEKATRKSFGSPPTVSRRRPSLRPFTARCWNLTTPSS